jgi:DNA-binding transcriptional LysR family regulator
MIVGIQDLCTCPVHKFTSMVESMWQWDDVRFFLAVSRNRSLSGAARALRVDHATVGRRIAAFEEQLGSKLFDRTPDGFAITAAGQAILSQCEAMESAAASVDRLVAGHDARLSGLVRVATTEGLAHVIIVPALAMLAGAHPQLQVEVMTDPRPLNIARRQADIAVRFGRPTDAELVCRKLGDCGLAPYASRAYLATHGVPERGKGLAGHSSVSYLGAPSWFSNALAGARVGFFGNSPFVQMRAVAAGIGIGIVPCCLGDDYPELQRLSPAEPPEVRPVWMIIHRDLRRVARIRLVANAIAEAFEHNRQVLRYGSVRTAGASNLSATRGAR